MKEYIFQIDDGLFNEETGEAVFKPKVVGELIRCKYCWKWKTQACAMGIKHAPVPDAYCCYGRKIRKE